MTTLPISVAIPTYRREAVLLDTLRYLLAQQPAPMEILVIDQTEAHEPATHAALQDLHDRGGIRWLRLPVPSIPGAMNRGLHEARARIVLFLDDDIRPEAGLIGAHHAAHEAHPDCLVAGRVIQPWEEGLDLSECPHFRFAGLRPGWIEEFMGGNFSLDRSVALGLGGFDENFVKVAYRFEAEFAHRLKSAGYRIRFEPAACVHHLKAEQGGTRTFGAFQRTWKPDHAIGAYYFALRTRTGGTWVADFATRLLRSVATRQHLRRPWSIVSTLVSELRGMAAALALAAQGPRLARKDPPID